jgi:hypothetical protein
VTSPQHSRIDTTTGVRFDFDDFSAADIRLADIAGALSRVCRFGGHARCFYSVAQHAVLVHDLVIDAGRRDLALSALHHDSHEAYAGDIPTPLKRRLASETNYYTELCANLDAAIGDALGFVAPIKDSDDYAAIDAADQTAFLIEAHHLLHDGGAAVFAERGHDADALSTRPLNPLAPPDAEEAFLAAHNAARTVIGQPPS